MKEKTKPFDHINSCWGKIWQSSTPIHNNNFQKIEMEGSFLNIIKAMYYKSIEKSYTKLSLKIITLVSTFINSYMKNINILYNINYWYTKVYQ